MRFTGVLRIFSAYLNRNRLGELLVIKGVITAPQLREALSAQKAQQKPLGRILIEKSLISQNRLRFILGQQIMLRTLATMVLCLATLGATAGKKSRAGSIKDIPPGFSLASSASSSLSHITSYPALFGTQEKSSSNLTAFTKWTSMFERFELEMKSSSSSLIIQQWHENLQSMENLPLKEMASRVNSFVNTREYILDSKNWGQSDYWATPIEFMRRGGDCEDFAIAKYAALRALGVPEERLRMAIVHDTLKDIPHAVLVVYTDQGPYILDNQSETMESAAGAGRYRPIFSINRLGWWLHTQPDTGTMLASVQ